MPRNIEIKLRAPDLAVTRLLALGIGARDEGLLVQTDTFFHVTTGRLKLREIDGGHAELIAYRRADVAGVKASDYIVAPIAEPKSLLEALSASCGIRVVVRKRRELLMWRNVRIHLDRVEGLGEFLELESVIGEVDEAAAVVNLDELMVLLKLDRRDAVDVAYADLLAEVGRATDS